MSSIGKAKYPSLDSGVTPGTYALATLTLDRKGRATAAASAATTGADSVVLSTSPVIVTPTIASLINMQHTHQNAAGGGSIDAAAIGSGTLANARVNWAAPSAIGSTTPAAITGTTGIFGTAGASAARLNVNAAASGVGLVVRANATTPGNIQEWQNGSGTLLTYIDPSGILHVQDNGSNDARAYFGSSLSNLFILGNGSSGIFQIKSNASVLASFGLSNASILGALTLSSALEINPGSGNVDLKLNQGLWFWTLRNSASAAAFQVVNITGSNAVPLAVSTGNITTLTATDSVAGITNVAILDHALASGGASAGFGPGLLLRGTSSIAGTTREMGRVRTEWTTPTDLSRASKMVLSTYAVGSEVTGIEILGSDVSIDNGIVYARNLVARSTGSSAASNTAWFNLKSFDGSSPVADFYDNNNVLRARITAAGVVTTSTIAPLADSTTALKLTKADGSTAVVTLDTTNRRITFPALTASGSAGEGLKFNNGTNDLVNIQGIDVSGVTLGFFSVNRYYTGSAWASTGFNGGRSGASLQLQDNTLNMFMFPASSNTPTQSLLHNVTTTTLTGTDAAAAAVTDVAIIDHSTSGTPAANYGTGLRFRGQDSTTPSQEMGRVRTVWTDPTHLTRASRMVLSAYAIGVETDALTILSSGNVGIGTPTPGALLEIKGSGSHFLRISAATNHVELADASGNIKWYEYLIGNDLSFYDTSDRLYLKAGGNIGIGTTSPSGLLDVNDDHIRVRTAKTPASAGAAGNQGDIAWDSSFVYICVATNTWRRTAHATW